ncbi:hypothetical protein Pfo_020424 [Paulownia fortunei]|nr:hypothetical protein Pfo_020424 [Paulownia fortunei]
MAQISRTQQLVKKANSHQITPQFLAFLANYLSKCKRTSTDQGSIFTTPAFTNGSTTLFASSHHHRSHFLHPTQPPDSANSSPRSRSDTWDDHPLAPIPGAKLRFMCSYGGHIIPRPHNKSLCYVGGDTRIVVVDRHSSLAELHSRLSHTLLNGRHFTLKYQLPTEDLDSLISLATDEDLENMIEEYDRTTSPETTASMGSLLDDAKSETWFVDALNGAGLLPRGLSEPAAIDTLLELDHGMVNSDSCADLEAQNESLVNNKQVVAKSNAQEVVLDSPPVVETSSSFGSSSSSPSMANLPPIKVRGESYMMVGLDEQLSHVVIASSLANAASPPLPYFSVAGLTSGGGVNSSAVGGENLSRVICDDEKSEKSDQGTVAPTGLRKPPLPLQPVQRKLVDIHNLPSPDSKHAGGYNLPSPDSVASDCSIASAGSLSKHTFYPDGVQLVNREHRVPTPVIDQKISNIQEPSCQVSVQQLVDTVSVPPPHQHQQFIRPCPTTHYIQHPAVPMSSYYPMYLHPQTQQSIQHQTDPQYPMYLLPPLTQTQPCYDAHSNRPLTPPPNNMVPYKEAIPPLYPTKHEMAANMHPTTGTGATPVMVQVPTHQFQQQYIGLSQIPPPAQSNAASAAGANYGYEYSHHMQDQVYYAQHLAASAPPSQYQTMTPAAAVMFSQASSQLPADSNAQQS